MACCALVHDSRPAKLTVGVKVRIESDVPVENSQFRQPVPKILQKQLNTKQLCFGVLFIEKLLQFEYEYS